MKNGSLVHTDPFAGLDPPAIYKLLTEGGRPDLPRWPPQEVQRMYTGTFGPMLVRGALVFIDMLDKDGAFVSGWRGLDYGAGFGRIASLMLSKGEPKQLDLADAWERSLALLREGRFQNRILPTSELVKRSELPHATYDVIFSFSVFTHLAPDAFWHNLDMLMRALSPTGRLYITVRGPDFVVKNYADKADAITKQVSDTGYWFMPTKGNIGAEPIFGEMVISADVLKQRVAEKYGGARYLGQVPGQMQHVYVIDHGA